MAALDLTLWAEKIERNLGAIFTQTALGVHDSIVFGSAVTKAPGQPVDTGYLRSSWVPNFTSAYTFETSTVAEYAPAIEAGVGPHGPMTLRSAVGGFHSVELTRTNFDRLVEDVTRRTIGA